MARLGERTDEQALTGRLERTGPLATGAGPARPHVRASAGGPEAPPPARDSDERPPPHHQPALSEPDPGPCLRLWGLLHRPLRRASVSQAC